MAGNPFVGDAGDFDPEAPQPAAPIADPTADTILDGWQPDRVKRIVRAQGITTHELIGVGQEDWLWRPWELEALAEPLAATLNEIPMARAAAAVSDELTVGAVMLEYSLRSIRERTRVIRARKAEEEAALASRPRPGAAPAAGLQHEFGVNGRSPTGYSPDDVGAEPATPVSTDHTEWRVPGE